MFKADVAWTMSNLNLMPMNLNFFAGKVKAPEFQQLSEGDCIVNLSRFEEVNSFIQYNGEEKDNLPPWQNLHPQLALTMVSAEEGKPGAITHRMNGKGWKKYSQLTEEEKASGKYDKAGDWAITADENGKTVRIEDPEKTKICENMLAQALTAMGCDVGGDIEEELNHVIENKVQFKITVSVEPYADPETGEIRDQHRVTRFRPVAQLVLDSEFDD